MSTIAKVFVVLNLVLAVAFLGAAATFLGYVDSYRSKFDVERSAHDATRVAKDREINDLKSQVTNLTAQVTSTQGERTVSQEKEAAIAASYANLKTAYDTTAAALTRATAALTVANDTIKGLSTLNDELRKDRDTLAASKRSADEERGAAVKSMNQAQLDLENTRGQIRELEQKLAACEDARARLDFQVTAAARGGGTTGPGEPQPPQTAKVTAADPRSNIVVISIGSEDGVKAGYRFIVSRGSSYVGTIEITSTEAKQSAGRSIRDLQKTEIRVGDDASSR